MLLGADRRTRGVFVPGGTGEGLFSLVADAAEASDAASSLQPRFHDAPEWWLPEQSKRFAGDILKLWRIRPDCLAGRHDQPPAA